MFMATVLGSPEHLESPQTSSSMITCDLAQEATRKQLGSQSGPHPEWPPPTTRLIEALDSFEPLSLLLYPFPPSSNYPIEQQAAACRTSWALLCQTSKTPKSNLREPHSLPPKPHSSFLTPHNHVPYTKWKINDKQPGKKILFTLHLFSHLYLANSAHIDCFFFEWL